MCARDVDTAGPRRRRLSPDDRRLEILEVARRVFAQRPYRTVSTAEIADAAGVARSLVHHYFGGIRGVFLAVAAEGAIALSAARTAGPELPFAQRTAHNVAAALDVIDANRETWLALATHTLDPETDADILALVATTKEQAIQRTLAANADVLEDTPAARFALRCFGEFTVEATRLWLVGEHTREATEALLLTAGRQLILHTIPALAGGPEDEGR